MSDIANDLDQISHRHDQSLSKLEQITLDRAIDQLRWRRVEDELPTEDGTYQVATEFNDKVYPDYAMWGFGGKWDGIPPESTRIKWWRPLELPEAEG